MSDSCSSKLTKSDDPEKFRLSLDSIHSLPPTTKVSRPLAIPSIPLRGVTPSPRHIHTTSPSHLPLTLKNQIKVHHPKSKVKELPRARPGEPHKRTWKDRIGTVQGRIYSRLAEEDKDWKVRLKLENQYAWKEYVKDVYQEREELAENFGSTSRWLKPGSRRTAEHRRILELWKSGRKSFDEERNTSATKPAKKEVGVNLREEEEVQNLEEQSKGSEAE